MTADECGYRLKGNFALRAKCDTMASVFQLKTFFARRAEVLIQQIQGIWLDHPGRCAIESPERVILI